MTTQINARELQALQTLLQERYPKDECPALTAQHQRWQEEKPLQGVRVLDATPLFLNTLVKHLVLLAGGAELIVGVSQDIPRDEAALQWLQRIGVPVVDAAVKNLPITVDVITDCAGSFRRHTPRLGVVELTRSGAQYYQNSSLPAVLVDDSVCKTFETVQGTGDGFVRAMKQLGYRDFAGKRVLLLGCGKVGSGIAKAVLATGAQLQVVECAEKAGNIPAGAQWVDMKHPSQVQKALQESWCVVTATGVKNALEAIGGAETVLNNPQLILANMGVENEYGSSIPVERILNGCQPLNFILEEPTRMRFIDPTMALDNYCALLVAQGKSPAGLHPAPREMDLQVAAYFQEG